jgi:hypothetical protein
MTSYWVYYRDDHQGIRYMKAVEAENETDIHANAARLSRNPVTITEIKPITEEQMRVFHERLQL